MLAIVQTFIDAHNDHDVDGMVSTLNPQRFAYCVVYGRDPEPPVVGVAAFRARFGPNPVRGQASVQWRVQDSRLVTGDTLSTTMRVVGSDYTYECRITFSLEDDLIRRIEVMI